MKFLFQLMKYGTKIIKTVEEIILTSKSKWQEKNHFISDQKQYSLREKGKFIRQVKNKFFIFW